MFSLSRETHYYLIEAVSDQDHVRTILAKRFLNFIQAIRTSSKQVLRELLKVVEYDTQSVTCKNLQNILLKTEVHDVRLLKPNDYNEKYRGVPSNDVYRVGFIKELINSKVEVEE